MFEEFGTIYTIILVMLFISVIADGVNFFLVFRKDKLDPIEFSTYGIKKAKIGMYIFAVVVLAFFLLTQEYTAAATAVHIVLILLLAAAAVLNIYFKKKYGVKPK